MIIKENILAWMLHNANTNPGHIPLHKNKFYKIKNKLLAKYGTHIAYDMQHIKKYCYACGGSGTFRCSWKYPEQCWNCRGTGIYTEFFVLLAVYKFGKYEFHLPKEKTNSPKYWWVGPDNKSIRRYFDDYISHTATKWSTDCRLCLYLIYRPKVFFEMLGKVGYGQKTPLSFVCNCAFELDPGRLYRKIKNHIVYLINRRKYKDFWDQDDD